MKVEYFGDLNLFLKADASSIKLVPKNVLQLYRSDYPTVLWQIHHNSVKELFNKSTELLNNFDRIQ